MVLKRGLVEANNQTNTMNTYAFLAFSAFAQRSVHYLSIPPAPLPFPHSMIGSHRPVSWTIPRYFLGRGMAVCRVGIRGIFISEHETAVGSAY